MLTGSSKGLDIYVIDVTDREKKYSIILSAKSLRGAVNTKKTEGGGAVVKYTRKFTDYWPIQNTYWRITLS